MRNFKEVEQHILRVLKKDLPDNLYYHGMHHTIDVLEAVEMIAREEGVTADELLLLKIAALYHDAGFTKVYRNHEEVGCEIARKDLPLFGFSEEEISLICGMIMATKIPQQPQNRLEQIIADADLEYLGTDDFKRIGDTLYEEVKVYFDVQSVDQWNQIQLNFLKNHQYHTEFCKKNREAQKQAHISELEKMVSGN